MKSVCFSDRFRHDIEDLMCSASGLVVRGILETMALDPNLALETVHLYLFNVRASMRNTLYADSPYAPIRTEGVSTLSIGGGWVYYLQRHNDCDPTIVFQEDLNLYTIQSIDSVIGGEEGVKL